ncbi:3-oxoacyl-(acyl-carrier-protein) synthase [Desulfocurvibacter africanus PCS]|uniref:3-oxoacyl-(Acyl-carrier-protein) synthase n=1 Tax=Desulfocurvibacter africanus PCS TaxID=1262666 RepID=M5PWD4_DESAF|nr:beta-ketoacyl-[acyl-carrier-protein] synthase family protein [Desulfocurvibacter africanus]EMG38300.1 3-oxoacyl-(acyl-carrier-protein) synthase [Desulfocurvibacter africanus PCS]
MSLKRVVVTGVGAMSPLGHGASELMAGLLQDRSGISRVEELRKVQGLRSLVAGLVPPVDPKLIDRKFRRSMSPMSIYATLASHEALAQAGVPEETISGGRLGLCIGSTIGSPFTYEEFFSDYLKDFSLERIKSTMFFKIMSHSCASNVAQALGVKGRIMAPAAACATGVQTVGLGFEAITLGKQDMMLCGGADELHPLTVATFDIISAASFRYNDQPASTPRPFDKDRDGTVCSEGCGILLLESLDSALSRGARILGEIVGFATTSDPTNISNPDPAAIAACMRTALEDAGLRPEQVDYINAHATATELGDIAESAAIHDLFGPRVPVSSLKGFLGHALAASGAIELIATLGMLERNLLLPTRNLETVDPRCAPVNFLRERTEIAADVAVKNNFALGGVNASLIVRRFHD